MLLTLLSCRVIYFSACVLFARSQRYTAEKCRASLPLLLLFRTDVSGKLFAECSNVSFNNNPTIVRNVKYTPLMGIATEYV